MAVLVAGGTGALGGAVLRELLRSGYAVTATWIAEREREHVEAEFRDSVELVHADVTDERATAAAVEAVRGLRDRTRINAVVVLTDGEDTDSSLGADEVVRALRAQGEAEGRVRVFTIAYSADAEGAEASLKRIAEASSGQAYTGNTEDIRAVYRSISSFF